MSDKYGSKKQQNKNFNSSQDQQVQDNSLMNKKKFEGLEENECDENQNLNQFSINQSFVNENLHQEDSFNLRERSLQGKDKNSSTQDDISDHDDDSDNQQEQGEEKNSYTQDDIRDYYDYSDKQQEILNNHDNQTFTQFYESSQLEKFKKNQFFQGLIKRRNNPKQQIDQKYYDKILKVKEKTLAKQVDFQEIYFTKDELQILGFYQNKKVEKTQQEDESQSQPPKKQMSEHSEDSDNQKLTEKTKEMNKEKEEIKPFFETLKMKIRSAQNQKEKQSTSKSRDQNISIKELKKLQTTVNVQQKKTKDQKDLQQQKQSSKHMKSEADKKIRLDQVNKYKSEILPSTNIQEDLKQQKAQGLESFDDQILLEEKRKKLKETKFWREDLSIFQKIQIIFYNSVESIIVPAMMINALLAQSLCTVVAVFSSIIIALNIQRVQFYSRQFIQQKGNESHSKFDKSTQIKNKLIIFQIFISQFVIIAKSVIVFNQKSFPIDDNHLQALGFRFNEEIDQKRTINHFKSIINDTIVVLFAAIYYFLPLRWEKLSHKGKFYIERKCFKGIEEDQIDELQYQTFKITKNSSNQDFSQSQIQQQIIQYKVNQQEIDKSPEEKTLEQVEDVVSEQNHQEEWLNKGAQVILGHPYFGNTYWILYILFIITLLVDIAVFRAVPQFIILLLMLILCFLRTDDIYKSKKVEKTYENKESQQNIYGQQRQNKMKFFDSLKQWITSIQIILISQLVQQIIVMFAIDNREPSSSQNWLDYLLHALGLQKWEGDETWENVRRGHFVIVSLSITIAQIFKQASQIQSQEIQKKEEKIQKLFCHQIQDEKTKKEDNYYYYLATLLSLFKYPIRIITVSFAYCYHNYLSLILLAWLFHSGIDQQLGSFSRKSRYYFVLFSLIVLFYYLVNMLHLYEIIDDSYLSRKWIYGIQKFNNPVIEVLLLSCWLLGFTLWIKYSTTFKKPNKVSNDDKYTHIDDIEGVDENYKIWHNQLISKCTNSKTSYSISNLIVLSYLGVIQMFLLSLLFFYGLTKVDLAHQSYLIFFLIILNSPNNQKKTSYYLVISQSFFILMKYIFSLYYDKNYLEDNKDDKFILLTQAFGLNPVFKENFQNNYYEFEIEILEWACFLINILYYFYLQQIDIKNQNEPKEKTNDKLILDTEDNQSKIDKQKEDESNKTNEVKTHEEFMNDAADNLSARFPKIYKVIVFFYNLKNSMIQEVFLMIFYFVCHYRNRSLSSLGYLIITSCLFYQELINGQKQNKIQVKKSTKSDVIDTQNQNQNDFEKYKNLESKNQSNQQQQKNDNRLFLWSIMVIYSTIILFMYVFYLFCQLPWYDKFKFFENISDYSVFIQPDIIGFKKVEDPKALNSDQISTFAPNMMFFLMSVYMVSILKKPKENDEKIQNDLQQSIDELSKKVLESKNEKIEMQTYLVRDQYKKYIKQTKNELDKKSLDQEKIYEKLRFTSVYIVYGLKNYWEIFDICATYYHLIIQIVVVFLCLYWWFNLVFCLFILSSVFLNIGLGKQLFKMKNDFENEQIQEIKNELNKSDIQIQHNLVNNKMGLFYKKVHNKNIMKDGFNKKFQEVYIKENIQENNNIEGKNSPNDQQLSKDQANQELQITKQLSPNKSQKLQHKNSTKRSLKFLKQNDEKEQITDKTILKLQETFFQKLKQALLEQKFWVWEYQLILIQIVLIICYATHFLQFYYEQIEQNDPKKEKTKTILYSLFISGLYRENLNFKVENNQEQDLFVLKSYSLVESVYGYLLILLLLSIESITIIWLKNKFGADQETFLEKIEKFQIATNSLKDKISKYELIDHDRKKHKQIEKALFFEELRKNQADKSVVEAYFNYKANGKQNHETEANQEKQVQDETNKELTKSEEKNNENYSQIKKEIYNRIEIKYKLRLMEFARISLENCIIFSLCLSALGKMNFYSILYFMVVILNLYCFKGDKGIRFINNFVSILLFFRFTVFLLNMDPNSQSMSYPSIFKNQTAIELAENYNIPLFYKLDEVQKEIYYMATNNASQSNTTNNGTGSSATNNESKSKLISLGYYFSMIAIKNKISSFIFDIIIVCLCYIYFTTCSQLNFEQNYTIINSHDTNLKIDEYVRHSKKHKYNHLTNKNQKDNKQQSQQNKEPETSRMNYISKIKEKSKVFSAYLFYLRNTQIFYQRFVLVIGLFMAILTQNITSGLIVLFFCFSTHTELGIASQQKAGKSLRNWLSYFIVPLVLIEFFIQIILQIPYIEQKHLDHFKARQIFGWIKFWKMKVDQSNNHLDLDWYFQEISLRLFTKVMILFLVVIQIHIIDSIYYQKEKGIENFHNKGKLIVKWENNQKVQLFLEYQLKNSHKEQMIEKVSSSFEIWHSFFNKVSDRQYEKDQQKNQEIKTNQSHELNYFQNNTQNEVLIQFLNQNKDQINTYVKQFLSRDMEIKKQEDEQIKEQRDEEFNKKENEEIQKRVQNEEETQKESEKKQVQEENQKRDKQKALQKNLEYENFVKQLPFLIRLYIKIRYLYINPAFNVNSKQSIKRVQNEIENVEIVKSKLELAIQSHVNHQYSHPEKFQKQLTFLKQIFQLLKLTYQFLRANQNHLAYLSMILEAIWQPGLVTLVYPFALFGYAIMIDPRPPKQFWTFIIWYTQILLVLQFTLSMDLWHPYFFNSFDLQNKFNEYYIGLNIVYRKTEETKFTKLLTLFLPKVLALCFSINYVHLMSLYGIYINPKNKDINQENLQTAYWRVIKKLYGIEKDPKKIDKKTLLPYNDGYIEKDENVKEQAYVSKRFEQMKEIRDEKSQYEMQQSLDDFYFQYNEYEIDKQKSEYKIKWNEKFKDLNYLDEIQDNQDGKKSQFDPFEFVNLQKPENIRKLQKIVEKQQTKEEYKQIKEDKDQFKKKMLEDGIKIAKPKTSESSGNFLTDNELMKQLYPDLKIQKPGIDYYQLMVLIQFAIIIYILVGTTEMFPAEKKTVVEQLNTNNLSSHMVVFLFFQVIIIIIDRIIYKNKTISKSEIKEQKQTKNQEQVDIFSLIRNSDRNVSKFYFQWIMLFAYNYLIFFHLPLFTNIYIYDSYYCIVVEERRTQKCSNDINSNPWILGLYLLFVLYFYVSAIQIKYGQPEVLTTYFMMGGMSLTNKICFQIFYNFPFLFELRTMIDWLSVQSSLDVYQWIKLNQLQVEFFKSKISNKYYKEKETGKVFQRRDRLTLGSILVITVVFILLVPMLLFSSFDILGTKVPVFSPEVRLDLIINNQRLELFESTIEVGHNKTLNTTEFKNLRFDQSPKRWHFQPNQVQHFQISENPDQNDLKDKTSFLYEFGKKLETIKKQNLTDSLSFELKIMLNREAPPQFLYPNLIQKFSPQLGIEFNETVEFLTTMIQSQYNYSKKDEENIKISCQKIVLQIGNFYSQFILSGTTNIGEKIELEKNQNLKSLILSQNEQCFLQLTQDNVEKLENEYMKGKIDQQYKNHKQSLNFSALKNSSDYIFQENQINDLITTEKNQKGISFFVFSKKVLPAFLGVNLVTFYITIIYAIFRLFRSTFVPVVSSIFITDAPNPDDLLQICEIIHLYRMKEMFVEEEELYFLLVDIMRSPMVFKQITGEYKKTKQTQGLKMLLQNKKEKTD